MAILKLPDFCRRTHLQRSLQKVYYIKHGSQRPVYNAKLVYWRMRLSRNCDNGHRTMVSQFLGVAGLKQLPQKAVAAWNR